MPEGTPYSSFIKPYPIRVDDFRDNLKPGDTIPALHLLSHTHTDHLPGLDAKSFGSIIICSIEAKEMLLRYESWRARTNLENQVIVEKERTYSHLKTNIRMRIGEIIHTANRDLLRPLPSCTPTRFQISNNDWVTITLLDANHCPGAVMFLLEGSHGSVLHTGDFRCESSFIARLEKNPFVQRYISRPDPSKPGSFIEPEEILETIFIDTENVLANYRVLPKDKATDSVVQIIKRLAPDKRFYINSWTWGYEDILKAVALAFSCKIHVDRYKYEIYTHINDPVLASIITRDPESTRFHACERFDRCSRIRPDDPDVIYINPAKMSIDRWEQYHTELMTELEREEVPRLLLVPFSRHSPLPELQDFVRLFRPKRIVPNSLKLELYGMDWACMPSMFSSCLSEGGFERMQEDLRLAGILDNAFMGISEDAVIEDPAMDYLMGNNAQGLVTKWASEPGFFFDGGRMETRIRVMQGFLPGGLRLLVERALRHDRMEKLAREKPMLMESDNGDSSQSQEDERGRTADFLFGGNWEASSVSSVTALSSPITSVKRVSRSPEKKMVASTTSSPEFISACISIDAEASADSVYSGLHTPPPTLPVTRKNLTPSPLPDSKKENLDPSPFGEYLLNEDILSNNLGKDQISMISPKLVKPPFIDLRNLRSKSKCDASSSHHKRRKISTEIDPSTCVSYASRGSQNIFQEDSITTTFQRTEHCGPKTNSLTAPFPTPEFESVVSEVKSRSFDTGDTRRKPKRKHEYERINISRKLLVARPDLDVSQSFDYLDSSNIC